MQKLHRFHVQNINLTVAILKNTANQKNNSLLDCCFPKSDVVIKGRINVFYVVIVVAAILLSFKP